MEWQFCEEIENRKLRRTPMPLVLFALQFFQGLEKRLRIVAGSILIFDPEQIGLDFSVTAKFFEAEWNSNSCYLPYAKPCRSAKVNERKREHVPGEEPGGRPGPMSRCHMRDLARHHRS